MVTVDCQTLISLVADSLESKIYTFISFLYTYFTLEFCQQHCNFRLKVPLHWNCDGQFWEHWIVLIINNFAQHFASAILYCIAIIVNLPFKVILLDLDPSFSITRIVYSMGHLTLTFLDTCKDREQDCFTVLSSVVQYPREMNNTELTSNSNCNRVLPANLKNVMILLQLTSQNAWINAPLDPSFLTAWTSLALVCIVVG